jgi:hypothetical protein
VFGLGVWEETAGAVTETAERGVWACRYGNPIGGVGNTVSSVCTGQTTGFSEVWVADGAD